MRRAVVLLATSAVALVVGGCAHTVSGAAESKVLPGGGLLPADADRVLLIRQYRHPVAMALFEPPAGLLDIPGETPWGTAARELAEEAGYRAGTWHTLVDMLNSPGGSSEAIRGYLARDLHALPEGRPHTGEAEEGHLPRAWVPLDEAVGLVLAGTIQSPSAVCGILAAARARDAQWRPLRPFDAPWASRATLEAADRVNPSKFPRGCRP